MTKSLADICEDMRDEIANSYDLGHGDAEELFKSIWTKMVAGPNSKAVEAAITQIEEAFAI